MKVVVASHRTNVLQKSTRLYLEERALLIALLGGLGLFGGAWCDWLLLEFDRGIYNRSMLNQFKCAILPLSQQEYHFQRISSVLL